MSVRLAALLGAAVLATLPRGASAQQHEHDAHGEHGEHGEPTPAAAPSRPSDDGSSEFEHSPPDPPAETLPAMPHREMLRMMTMDDTARFGRVTFDQLERRAQSGHDATAWEAWAYYGSDIDKAWLKTEGRRAADATHDARIEGLWDHVFARWWSAQTGLRHDFGAGGTRDWWAIGVQGLAPGLFETELTAYLRNDEVALRASIEYDLLLTQRLVLQPALDGNAFSRADPGRGRGSGITDAAFGLRLRYEIRREFAPYIGVRHEHRFGRTADLARDAGELDRDWQAVAGLRAWW